MSNQILKGAGLTIAIETAAFFVFVEVAAIDPPDFVKTLLLVTGGVVVLAIMFASVARMRATGLFAYCVSVAAGITVVQLGAATRYPGLMKDVDVLSIDGAVLSLRLFAVMMFTHLAAVYGTAASWRYFIAARSSRHDSAHG